MLKSNVKGRKRRFLEVLTEIAKAKGVTVSELDLNQLVGDSAGAVYQALDGKGEVPLRDLKEQVSLRGPLMMAAVGWLMREDKVAVRVSEGEITVRLQ